MKPTERTQDQSAELLVPDYGIVAEKFAAKGIVRNEQDVYFGKVKDRFAKDDAAVDFCWCADAYENEEISSDISPQGYRKKIVCVSELTGNTDVFEARNVEVEEIKAGSTFELNGARRMLPRYKALENPYVLSLADALEMCHKFGFVKAEIDDIFIGTFSFRNFQVRNTPWPDVRSHFGIGLCYMVDVIVAANRVSL